MIKQFQHLQHYMFLSNPFPGAFGLDIGDLSLKLIQLKYHGLFKKQPFFTVKETRSISLPPGYIVDGEIQQPEMVRKKILQILGKDGSHFPPLKSPWVIADLPEPKTFLKIIETEQNPEDLTGDDIAFQIKKHLPLAMDETYLDWQIFNPSPTPGSARILVGAVSKITADLYTYLLESAGLSPLALEIEAVSIARALITASKDYTGQARALLDLGATRSSLIIYDQGVIQFSTNLKFSGEVLTTALAQALKISHGEAEKIKLQNGLSFDPTRPDYLKIVTDQANGLITEIEQALMFYRQHFSGANPVTHITMCGGIANMKNLDLLIAKKLRVGANAGRPWKNLFNPSWEEGRQALGLSYASAIGLALRAAHEPLNHH